EGIMKGEKVITMPTAAVLELDSSSVFKQEVLFETDESFSWNEVETTNFVDDTIRYNPAAGEVKKAYPAVIALSRNVGDREQRILVTADADWLSNGELGLGRKGVRSGNFELIMASFYWLSDGEVPIDMRRDTPPDRTMSVGKAEW